MCINSSYLNDDKLARWWLINLKDEPFDTIDFWSSYCRLSLGPPQTSLISGHDKVSQLKDRYVRWTDDERLFHQHHIEDFKEDLWRGKHLNLKKQQHTHTHTFFNVCCFTQEIHLEITSISPFHLFHPYLGSSHHRKHPREVCSSTQICGHALEKQKAMCDFSVKRPFTLPETNSKSTSHLKMDGWNMIVSFWGNLGLFAGANC